MPDCNDDLHTLPHSVPGSVVVRKQLGRSLPIPFVILICAIAISAYLALGDWRWLVVLLILIFIVGTSLYALAWLHAISSPAAVEATRRHIVSLTHTGELTITTLPMPTSDLVVQEKPKTRKIPITDISAIAFDANYITVTYTSNKYKSSNIELYIPISAFPKIELAREFYSRLNAQLFDKDI